MYVGLYNLFSQKIYTKTIVRVLSSLPLLLIPFGFTQKFVISKIGQNLLFLIFVVFLLTVYGVWIVKKKQTNKIEIKITKVDFVLFLCILYLLVFLSIFKKLLDLNPLFYFNSFGFIIFFLLVKNLHYNRNFIPFYIFILLTLSQSIYGLLQLSHIFPTNHNQFDLTGSFNNPGPFAGYLASLLPFFILSFLLVNSNEKYSLLKLKFLEVSNKILKKNSKIKRIRVVILIFSFVITLIAILLTKSRAAWLAALISSTYFVYHFFRLEINKKQLLAIKDSNVAHFFLKKHKYLTVFLLFVFFAVISFALYQMKKDSADGRLLIWKVTSNMIKDKPLLGHGINGFEANYMNYQAEFFKQNPNSRFVHLADNNIYAFNEFLRITSEYGLIGLLIVLAILYFIFEGKFQENINTQEKLLLLGAKAGIISIFVFSLFSYPLEILPIKINLVLYIAIISSFQKPIFTFNLINIWLRRTAGIILIVFSIALISYVSKIYIAQRNWKLGYTSLQLKAYKHSIRYFEDAFPVLNNNGEFLIQYGKALTLSGEYKKAITQLEHAEKYLPNTIVYTTLGDCYKNVGEFDLAKESYIKAFNMVPNRLYPEYLLAKLYFENGKSAKALELAKKVITQKPKVNSLAVTEIKDEMQQIKKIIENK